MFSGFYFMHDNPHELILMEDEAPMHHNKLPEDWRQAHGIQKLVWPPNSPDLNPIENLWKILKDLLRHHNMSRNKLELIEIIQKVWNETSLEQLKQLISSMLNRIKVVILERGGSTRW